MQFFELRAMPFVGDPLAAAWLAFSSYRHVDIAREILGDIVTSPLGLTYWSGSPYWLGSAASEEKELLDNE